MALRLAKLDLVEKFGDQAVPYYWAGFKMVGEGTGIISIPGRVGAAPWN